MKNYTSNVPAGESIARIERVLIRCGVLGITKEYGPEGEIAAISFQIKMADDRKLDVRLPADKGAALNALWLDYAGDDKLSPDGSQIHWNNYKKKKRKDFAEQAERTAWKLMQDWVEIQMSLIQMQQAETVEVFMPYIVVDGQTFFQRLKGGGYKALLAAPKES